MDTKYCYPGTDVLINRYDIKDSEKLQEAERNITSVRAAELEKKKKPGKFRSDFARLKQIHKELFKDVYSWAGKPREVDISKGNSMFCNSSFIEPMAEDIFGKLQKENSLEGLEQSNFIDRLAYYMGEVNALHPFREGNGRTQRFFFEELATAAGYELDFSKANKQELLKADISAMHQSTEQLKGVLAHIVKPLDAPERTTEKKASIHDRIRASKIKGKPTSIAKSTIEKER